SEIMKLTRPLVVLDLETTGTWIEKDRIIEIALIKIHPDLNKEIFHTKINPAMAIPPRVTEITGIRNEDVKDAPAFGNIAGKVLEFLADADLGGFNVERFDLPLLAREMLDAGLKFDYSQRTIYDAQKIFHLHQKRDLSSAFMFYCHQ
ncbi:exonuclease domain-containing protein, partial [Staphylococcus aureus]|uniref:3'-5' exonuclease n=1 Tax=Staphylococcus aureus TaxID=1280 RepID=UPI0039BE7DD3